MSKLKRIKKARIRFVSLCQRGANHQPVILKGDDQFELTSVAKFDEVEGILTSLVWPNNYVDAQKEFTDDPEVVKDMMYGWAKEGAQLDLTHDFKAIPREQAYPVEFYQVQKGDSRFADWVDLDGKKVDSEGAWALSVKLEAPHLLEKAKRGELNGFSMGGTAEREEVTKSTDGLKVAETLEALRTLLGKEAPTTPEPEMTPEQLEAALAKALAPVNARLEKLETPAAPAAPAAADQAPATPPADPPASEAPVAKYEGDLLDFEAMHKFAIQQKLIKLQKAVDFTDPASIEKYAADVAALGGEPQAAAPAAPEQQRAPAPSAVPTHVAKDGRLVTNYGEAAEFGLDSNLLTKAGRTEFDAADQFLKDNGYID